jgi:PAS domain S-box-containing protein
MATAPAWRIGVLVGLRALLVSGAFVLGGVLVRLLAAGEEALRLKDSERKARGRREALEAILDSLPDTVIHQDEEQRVVEVFGAGEWAISVPAQGLAAAPGRAAESGAGAGVVCGAEYDGTLRRCETRTAPHVNGGTLTLVRDVTERWKEERIPRLLERALLGGSAIVIVTDAEARVEFVNDAFSRITGYSAEEARRNGRALLRTGKLDGEAPSRMWDRLLLGKKWRGDVQFARKDGRPLWVDAEVVPVLGGDGKPVAFVSVQFDITERKNREAWLMDRRLEAEETSRATSGFLSMMSHELRTPLNGVLGMLQIIRGGLTDPELIECADIAERSGFGLVRVLTDILDLASAKEAELALELFSLDQLIHDVFQMFRPDAQAKGLAYSFERRYAQGATVVSNAYRLRQILFALVSNAVKFTKAGSVVVSCWLDGDRGENLMIEVRDTGIGISEEELPRVFEPFRQVDQSLTRHYGGMGVGLALAKKFCDQLGGRIRIRSVRGEGTSALVLVPVEGTAAFGFADGIAAGAGVNAGRVLSVGEG